MGGREAGRERRGKDAPVIVQVPGGCASILSLPAIEQEFVLAVSTGLANKACASAAFARMSLARMSPSAFARISLARMSPSAFARMSLSL